MAERAPGDGLELALRGQRSGWRNARVAAEAEQWARLLAPLALAMPGVAPPLGLGTRIGLAVDQAESDLGQTVEERLEEGCWREIASGVEIKPLWDDKTFLIRCGPGGIYPGTLPRRVEHCVILQGDMLAGGESYEAGDYQRLSPDRAQGAFTSRTGLLMLIRYR